MKRSCRANKREIWISNFIDMFFELDDWGNQGSTPIYVYETPKRYDLCISPGRGEAEDMVFGKSLDYNRVIGPAKPDAPFNEYTRIWIGINPEIVDNKETVAWNHIVSAIADSKNKLMIAVKQVSVSL